MTKVKGDPPQGSLVTTPAEEQEKSIVPEQKTIQELQDVFGGPAKWANSRRLPRSDSTATAPPAEYRPYGLIVQGPNVPAHSSVPPLQPLHPTPRQTPEEKAFILKAMKDPSFRALESDSDSRIVLDRNRTWAQRVLYGSKPQLNDRILVSGEYFPVGITTAIQANQQQAMPQLGAVAKVIREASLSDLDEAFKNETLIKVHVFGKDAALTLRQIIVLIATDAGDKRLFCHYVSKMLPPFLPNLADATSTSNPVTDLTLLLYGCLVCARDMFVPGFDSVKTAQLGVSMLESFYKDIAMTADGAIASKEKEKTLKILAGDIAHTMLADIEFIEAKATPSQLATYFTRFSQQVGSLNAIMFQAALEHAKAKEKSKDRQAKIATILLDITVVAIGAVLATHAPPALACIPPAIGFVSTHIVPAIVGQRDYVSALKQARSNLKAESVKRMLIVAPEHPDGDVPLALLQARQFYRDMYFVGWDIVADACAKKE